MLDFDTALEIMNKYGYTSTTLHPYVVKKGDKVGVCFSYVDEFYGILERIKFFDTPEIFEEFIKKLKWFKDNGKKYNVRIALDNYEIESPKVMFIRNGKLMVKGEMFNIEGFDEMNSQKKQMDEVSRTILLAGNLLVIFDEMKAKQKLYFKELNDLRNDLRNKYYQLQKEVDYYNDVEVERELSLLSFDASSSGINEMMEFSVKDRYNNYKVSPPSLDDAKQFVKDVWDLNQTLEINSDFFDAHVEENAIRNEMKVVEAKLKYMKDLNDKEKKLFKVNLVKNFRNINKECKKNSILIDKDFSKNRISSIDKKYSYFNILDFYSLDDYLREAMENTNYSDLSLKYAKQAIGMQQVSIKLPLNEIAANLLEQYNSKLSDDEQSALILYNSMYKKVFDLILSVPNYDSISSSELVGELNKNKDIKSIKNECFEIVKNRLDEPSNINIKNRLFNKINYDTFETFISSLVEMIKMIKSINNRMVINSDLNMYMYIDDINNLSKMPFVYLDSNLNNEIPKIKSRDERIIVAMLKQSVPVLYSPYMLDFGEFGVKDGNTKMELKVVSGFNLLVELADVLVNKDDTTSTVVRYFSEPKKIQEITVVDELKMSGQTTFVKIALLNNLGAKTQSQVGQTVSAITSNVVQQDTNIPVSSGVAQSSVLSSINTLNKQSVELVDSTINIEPEKINNDVVPDAPMVQDVKLVSQPVQHINQVDQNNGGN